MAKNIFIWLLILLLLAASGVVGLELFGQERFRPSVRFGLVPNTDLTQINEKLEAIDKKLDSINSNTVSSQNSTSNNQNSSEANLNSNTSTNNNSNSTNSSSSGTSTNTSNDSSSTLSANSDVKDKLFYFWSPSQDGSLGFFDKEECVPTGAVSTPTGCLAYIVPSTLATKINTTDTATNTVVAPKTKYRLTGKIESGRFTSLDSAQRVI